MHPIRLPSPERDRRAVSSTVQAILLVALVTVTVAAIGYAVLGLILVDDSPGVERVKFHVSDDGITVTPLIADPLPADDVEVRIERVRRNPTRVTIEDVAGAAMATDVGRYLAVDDPGGPGRAPVSSVESHVGRDAATPAEASWRAGQPLHVGTRPGFVRQGDVLTIQVVDRKHQALLVEKDVRVTALPKTIIYDVEPAGGGDADPVPPDAGGDASGADRSETGGAVDRGDIWDRASRAPTDLIAGNPVVARARRGGAGGAGGASGASPGAAGARGAGGGTGGISCSGGCDAGDVTIPEGFLSDGFGSSGDGGGSAGAAGAGGGGRGNFEPMTGETLGDSIDASQSAEIQVTNGDGGAVMMSTGDGETIIAISGEMWDAVTGGGPGTASLSDFPQGAENRVERGLQGHNNAKAETTCKCAVPDGSGEGDSGATNDLTSGGSGSDSGSSAGGNSADGGEAGEAGSDNPAIPPDGFGDNFAGEGSSAEGVDSASLSGGTDSVGGQSGDSSVSEIEIDFGGINAEISSIDDISI